MERPLYFLPGWFVSEARSSSAGKPLRAAYRSLLPEFRKQPETLFVAFTAHADDHPIRQSIHSRCTDTM